MSMPQKYGCLSPNRPPSEGFVDGGISPSPHHSGKETLWTPSKRCSETDSVGLSASLRGRRDRRNIGYNGALDMKVRQLHRWDIGIQEAKEVQQGLASRVSTVDSLASPRHVAGIDISGADEKGVAKGAAVLVSFPGLNVLEVSVVEDEVSFPYVPGLLSFRESPLVLKALEGLSIEPDLIMVDGQGMAHPRRFGIACHVGLLLDLPTIGCAKSRLFGIHADPGNEVGDFSELYNGDDVIGIALRTKAKTNPIYVSVGHRVSLDSARRWILECGGGYRVPEPTRYAHLAAGGKLKT